jgi:hypothetical protein
MNRAKEDSEKKIATWAKQRNSEKKKIKWTFTKQKADDKLSKHYVA